MITNINVTELAIDLEWGDGHVSVFHHIWLWDNREAMRHPLNGQRTGHPSQCPPDLTVLSERLDSAGDLEIEWSPDGSVSRYGTAWLRSHCYSQTNTSAGERVLWRTSDWPLAPIPTWADVSTHPTSLRSWLGGFVANGVALLRDVPQREGMAKQVGQIVSFITQNGWQVEHYDIRSKAGADVIADTPLALPAHTDDPYFAPPVQINLLHCLENEAEGGESTLSDGFRVAETIRQEHPAHFRLLSKVPIRFRLATTTGEFESEAPVVELRDSTGEIEMIRYSNQSTQPFHIPPEKMVAYYDAYRMFSRMVVDDEYEVRFRLKPGEMYMIDNARILHGRTASTSPGRRHMQACYVSRDGLRSKLAALDRATGDEPRFGHQ